MKNVAIIPAGGSGKRMGADLPKQYLLLEGMPILAHTLKVFQGTPLIDDIILIVPGDDISYVKRMIVDEYGLYKVRWVLAGGKERQDSVKNGLDAVGLECDIVVIHDGVRSFISAELITAVIQGALRYKAVTTGVPVRDTVKEVNPDGWVSKTIPRKGLWLTQTPQAFQRDVIKRAYERAYNDHFYGTDDAAIVERMDIRVKMIQGAYNNIKITMKEDLSFGKVLMKKK